MPERAMNMMRLAVVMSKSEGGVSGDEWLEEGAGDSL